LEEEVLLGGKGFLCSQERRLKRIACFFFEEAVPTHP
jgi:hypothetical protein